MFSTLREFFKAQPALEPLDEATLELIELCLDEYSEEPLLNVQISKMQTGRPLLVLEPGKQAEIVCHVVNSMPLLLKDQGARTWPSPVGNRLALFEGIAKGLLRKNLPFSEQQLQGLVSSITKCWNAHWRFPLKPTVKACEAFVRQAEFGAITVAALKRLEGRCSSAGDADMRRVGRRIRSLIDGQDQPLFKPGWPWVEAVRTDVAALSDAKQRAWLRILAHAATASSARPSRKWLNSASTLIEESGAELFLDMAGGCIRHILRGKFDEVPLSADVNSTLVKGIVWTVSVLDDPELVRLVHELGEYCFRKIPGYGAGSTKVGNAAIYTLGALPGMEAISKLTALRARVKYRQAQALIEAALERAANERGVSVDTLEELAVPTYELTKDGCLQCALGDFTGIGEIGIGGKVVLTWERSDGKVQKTAPKAVREQHPDALSSLRRDAKEIGKAWRAQRDRLERMLLRPREWNVADWRERYLDHPLMQHLTRKLIWELQTDACKVLALWHEGTLVDANGSEISIEQASSVVLWHPIGFDPSIVLAWRRFLESREITQPFKQAHREVYVLTDAERQTSVYSNRFAGHILRQHQLASLCRERGWEYQLQGQFDSYNIPTRLLADLGITVDFYCEAVGDDNPASGSGIYLYVSTDQVRFLGPGNQPLTLDSLPVRVFSELMRDVDLFVGVCSVGNDPNWADQGLQPGFGRYWESFAFGELSEAAKVRREVLEGLLPKLKIAGRCELDGRYLVVRGDIRTYRIHLGSGNIQMEPNNQYLCIVQGK